MALRDFVVVIYVIAFIVSIISILSIPQDLWRFLSLGQTLAFGFSLLVGFCGVLLAYYVSVDGENIRRLTVLTSKLCKAANLDELTDVSSYEPTDESSYDDLMLHALIREYYKLGVFNPNVVVEIKISEKMKLGKSREEAIAELYSEEIKG